MVGRVTGNIYTLIEGCSVTGVEDEHKVVGDAATGGLVGSNNSWRETPGGTDNPVISKSYAIIDVFYSDKDPVDNPTKIGGLTGCNQKGTVRDSFARGRVTVNNTNENVTVTNIGGLAGCIEIRGRVERVFSTGLVTVSGNTSNVGGLVGNVGTGGNAGVTEDSYWDTDSSGQNNSAGTSVGLDENQINDPDFLAGFDFDNVWDIVGGEVVLRDVPVTTYITWTGDTSTSWTEESNWNPARSPSENDIVIIPVGLSNYPIIDTPVELSSSPKGISIAGAASGGKSTPGSITIAPGGSLTVSSFILNSPGLSGLIIESDETGTGSLISNTQDLRATVKHYVKESTGSTWNTKESPTEWFYISHPVGTQTIATVLVNADLDGSTNRYDLYRWDEASDFWLNQQASNGDFEHIHFKRGTGYLFAAPQDVTFLYEGELHARDQRWENLSYSGDGRSDLDPGDYDYYTAGWHLLGNPFPSGIANIGWTIDGIVETPKIWVNGAYEDLSDEDDFIPANTAFFIQVLDGNDGSNTLIIPFSARAHEAPSTKNIPQNRILLVAQAEGSEMRQQHVIRLEPDAAEGFDPRYDSRFMAGYAPQLFSITETDRLSTLAIPKITDDLVIPMVFRKNHEGEDFLIHLERNIDDTDLYLRDLKTDTWHELDYDKPYAFTAEDDDDPIRFELHFSHTEDNDPVGIPHKAVQSTAQLWHHDNRLYVQTDESGTRLTIYDIKGRALQTYRPQQGLQSYHIELPPGAYIARLNGNNIMETKKITKKLAQ